MLRHWLLIPLAAILAVAAGYWAVDQFGKKRYSYQGKLFYSPNRVTEPYYVSPSLRDLQLAIIETPFLRSLHEDFDVDEDFKVFAYRIGFDVNGSSSLDVSYTGRDPDHTQRLVQGSMERFVDRAKELRRSALTGYVADFDQDIQQLTERYDDAKRRLEKELAPVGLRSDESLATEIDRLRQAITSYQSNLDNATMRRDLSDAQVQNLAMVGKSPKETTEGQTAANDDATDPDSLSSDPQRSDEEDTSQVKSQSLATYDNQMQKLLEDRIRRERETSSLQLQIDLKEKEFERSRSSFERDLISEAAFEKVRGELQLLKAQKSDRIQELEGQLSQINRRINDRTESLSVLDPATAASLMSNAVAGNLNLEAQTMALLKGSRTAAETNINQLTGAIAEANDQLARLIDTRRTSEPLIAEVETARAQLNRLREIKDEFARAQNSTQAELSIAQDATRLLEGEKNNYLKWFLAASMATFGLVVGPLFGYEVLKAWRESPDETTVFGLPVIGRKPSDKLLRKDPEAAANALQRLSLKIAHVYGRRDGVLALAGGVEGTENDDLIRAVADHYRRAGVTVSVADAVDLVAGSEASTIAGSWVAEAKQGRGLTLIRSPLMDHALAGETAASSSDAMVLFTEKSQSSSPALQRRIAELSGLGARVIGIVLDR